MKYALQGLIIALLVALLAPGAEAASGLDAITVTPAPGGGQTYSINIQILILMTVLTLLPAGLLMLTSFTRMVMVPVDDGMMLAQFGVKVRS